MFQHSIHPTFIPASKPCFVTALLLALFVVASPVLAITGGDPGAGSGPNASAMGGENSLLNKGGQGTVNLITGQSAYHQTVASIACISGFNVSASLDYSSLRSAVKVATKNEIANVGWVGLGFYLGFSYIWHDATLNKWFYRYKNGSVTEIILYTNGFYSLKADPLALVSAHVTSGIIDGWTIIDPDGNTYKYGDFSATVNGAAVRNAGRYKMTNSVVTEYFQWDLAWASDVNRDTIIYKYWQNIKSLPNNITYVGESYPSVITSNTGDSLTFNLGDKFLPNEGRYAATTSYDFFEYKYLSSISRADRKKRNIDIINFNYTVVGTGAGYVKKILSSITSTKGTGVFNTSFSNNLYGQLLTVVSTKTGKTLTFAYKNQTNNLTISVVDYLNANSGVSGSKDIKTTYTYTSNTSYQYYDTKDSIAYWGIVTQNTGAGNTVDTFDLSLTDYQFGLVLAEAAYNKAGSKIVSSVHQIYNNVINWDASESPYSVTSIGNTTKTVDGVAAAVPSTPSCGLNYTNNKPYYSYVINSDGTALVKKTAYAYQFKSAMQPLNMLSQAALVRTYKFPNFTESCDSTSAGIKIMGAAYTLWTNEFMDASGQFLVWRPKATYTWVVSKAASGDPDSAFVNFNESTPTAHNWKLTGTVEQYNGHGQVLQTSDPYGVRSCTIFRNDIGAPVAQVSNAKTGECIFTNYEINGMLQTSGPSAGYCSLTTVSANLHFAPKTLVCNTAPTGDQWVRTPLTDSTKTAGSLAGKVIRWEFWAKGSTNTASIAVIESPSAWLTSIPFNVSTSWQKYSFTYQIPAGVTQYRLSMRPPYNGSQFTPGAIYYDDIRAYPNSAMMTTMYYNDLWRIPVLSVDANNNPSKLTILDQYGRPFIKYKINSTMNQSDAGYATLVEQKEYQLMHP